MLLPQPMTNSLEIRNYILGGHGAFTLESLATGKHYTYRTHWSSTEPSTQWSDRRLFIEVMTGGADEYDYLGMVVGWNVVNGALRVILTRASYFRDDSPVVAAIQWFLRLISTHEDIRDCQVRFHHNGYCARCGRELTDPESIARGIGPVCLTHTMH